MLGLLKVAFALTAVINGGNSQSIQRGHEQPHDKRFTDKNTRAFENKLKCFGDRVCDTVCLPKFADIPRITKDFKLPLNIKTDSLFVPDSIRK